MGHSLFSEQYEGAMHLEFSRQEESDGEVTTLYADGFSVHSSVDAIECSRIWQDIEDKS